MTKMLLATTVAMIAAGFMSDTVPTTWVKGADSGPLRVNTEDFDADQAKPAKERQYEAYKGTIDPQFEVRPAAGATHFGPMPAPQAPTRLVMKEGRKYFVIDGTGAKVEEDGIDAEGYANEADAWTAIKALTERPANADEAAAQAATEAARKEAEEAAAKADKQ